MFNVFSTQVVVREGEPVGTEADGLVIPANDHLWMGSGLSGQIKQTGGEEIELAAVRQGPAELGRAVATDAGALGFKRLYHAVIMGQDLKVNPEAVRAAVAASLGLASEEGLSSLAIAPLESEEMATAFRETAQQIVDTLFEALSTETSLKRIILTVGRREAATAYREAFFQTLGGAGR